MVAGGTLGLWDTLGAKGSQRDAEEVPCRMVEWYHVSFLYMLQVSKDYRWVASRCATTIDDLDLFGLSENGAIPNLPVYSRSILHGYKLIRYSLLVLMGISTFTSKEFVIFCRVSGWFAMYSSYFPWKLQHIKQHIYGLPHVRHTQKYLRIEIHWLTQRSCHA